ncbi:transposase [Streptomyces sp. NPDC001604]|uniref:transposase n=1 Tax=Streptomyces sp. NPDC001604 TaxID=3364593 RepID=UPI00369C9D23
MWIRDHPEGLRNDGDFTAWYPRDGRPGLSPAQLATVCVLQGDEPFGPPAADAVRCRIDLKYALGLELEDPGFQESVLSDFRDRLAEGDRSDRLLGLALTAGQPLRDTGAVPMARPPRGVPERVKRGRLRHLAGRHRTSQASESDRRGWRGQEVLNG